MSSRDIGADMEDVSFSELAGKTFMLRGCDYFDTEIHRYGDEYDNAQCVAFLLDDRYFVATENPEDGYRSSLRELKARKATKSDIKNRFEPIQVQATHFLGDNGRTADILRFHAMTGELILEVGTDNTDDYYPSFVGNFNAFALTQAMKQVKPAAVKAAARAAVPIEGWGAW